jgi:transcription initiation factor TFIIIB Brf1 subunit/transcription initiation factor TFIIB
VLTCPECRKRTLVEEDAAEHGLVFRCKCGTVWKQASIIGGISYPALLRVKELESAGTQEAVRIRHGD